MKPRPDERVVEWTGAQDPSQLFVTAITVAEVSYGIARLRGGKRKQTLAKTAGAVFADFLEFTLPFDAAAAGYYGAIVATRERSGRPITTEDAQIASICRLHDAVLATRNAKDFVATGHAIVDPWI